MALEIDINAALITAMKAKDNIKMRSLRAIKAAIILAKTEKGDDELSAETELKLLQKLVKSRKDSITIFREQKREDLAVPEEEEVAVISEYLPEMMSEDDVKSAVQAIITSTGASGPSDIGKVMGASIKQLGSKSDGQTISRIAKELLS